MKSHKIFKEESHLDFKLFSFILVFCSLFITNEQMNILMPKSSKLKDKKVIYNYVDKEKCLQLNAYEYPANKNTFEKAKEEKVDGAFYHFDDENEIVVIEKFLSTNEIEISVRLWKKDKEIKAVLHSCSALLKSNKKELNKLVDNLK